MPPTKTAIGTYIGLQSTSSRNVHPHLLAFLIDFSRIKRNRTFSLNANAPDFGTYSRISYANRFLCSDLFRYFSALAIDTCGRLSWLLSSIRGPLYSLSCRNVNRYSAQGQLPLEQFPCKKLDIVLYPVKFRCSCLCGFLNPECVPSATNVVLVFVAVIRFSKIP